MADVATALAPDIVIVEDNGSGPFSETVRSGRHVLAADEPVAKGGNDTGPDPYAYLLDVMDRITRVSSEGLDDLLPDRWIAAHPDAIVEHRRAESHAAAERKRIRRRKRRAFLESA